MSLLSRRALEGNNCDKLFNQKFRKTKSASYSNTFEVIELRYSDGIQIPMIIEPGRSYLSFGSLYKEIVKSVLEFLSNLCTGLGLTRGKLK